jgi:hypothetical protein
VPVPCILLFLCFRKPTQEIFSELDETKAKVSIFPDMRQSPKLRGRGTRGQAHHRVARPSPWPRHQVVWPPGPPSDAALLLIYSPRRENLKRPINFHETYCKPQPSSTRDREGPEALPSTVPERGIPAKDLLHHHACLWSGREIGRVQKLFPTPCRRGESPPKTFFITMPASGVMCE